MRAGGGLEQAPQEVGSVGGEGESKRVRVVQARPGTSSISYSPLINALPLFIRISKARVKYAI